MISSTHLCMANIMYNYFSKKLNFKLHRPSFMLGNIKPDYYDTDIKKPHILDESLEKVIEHSIKLMKEDLSIKEFSLGLGVICHYICDYFCLYHDDTHKNINLIEHYFYELALHFKFLMLFPKALIKVNIEEENQNIDMFTVMSSIKDKYSRADDSIKKDITYALSTAILISERIICGSNISLKVYNDDKSGIGNLPEIMGGTL